MGLAESQKAISASVLFRLNAVDVVSGVDARWESVAPEVDGRRSIVKLHDGKRFANYIADASIRSIFKTLVDQARKEGAVSFEYRSDTVELRRWFTMLITSSDGEVVEFSSRVSRTEAWASNPAAEAGEPVLVLRLCSWCQRVAVPPDAWLPLEPAMEILNMMSGDQLPQVSNSICPSCQKELVEEARTRAAGLSRGS